MDLLKQNNSWIVSMVENKLILKEIQLQRVVICQEELIKV